MYKTDRDVVYSYIINRFGESKTAYVLALGTTQEKDAIDNIGRGLCYNWCVTRKSFKDKIEQRICEVGEDRAKAYRKSLIEELKKDPSNPYSLNKIAEVKTEYEEDSELAKKNHPDIFYYFDGIVGTYISQSMHPAGIIASPITLSDNYGTLYDSDGHKILQLDMECVHNVGLAKYDLLGLI